MGSRISLRSKRHTMGHRNSLSRYISGALRCIGFDATCPRHFQGFCAVSVATEHLLLSLLRIIALEAQQLSSFRPRRLYKGEQQTSPRPLSEAPMPAPLAPSTSVPLRGQVARRDKCDACAVSAGPPLLVCLQHWGGTET